MSCMPTAKIKHSDRLYCLKLFFNRMPLNNTMRDPSNCYEKHGVGVGAYEMLYIKL